MNVDIWSDIRCPFCYIGKRRFEEALSRFEHRDQVTVTWHSFELDPHLQTQPDKNPLEHLAEVKGQSLEWSAQAHEQLTGVAASVGLDFHFDRCVVANSFDAHRLIQFAKTKDLGDQAKERLLKAYFTEGINIADRASLLRMATEIGLSEEETSDILNGEAFSAEVRNDEFTAQRLGIRGVPFFVLDRQYGVSGAQMPETFLEALQHAWKERIDQKSAQDPVASHGRSTGDDVCDAEKGTC